MDKTNLAKELKAVMTASYEDFYKKAYKGLSELLEKHLVNIDKKEKPMFKRKSKGETYNCVFVNADGIYTDATADENENWDDRMYENNNYFYTEKRGQEVVDKVKLLMKLERLHDIYCPDYEPDWDSAGEKFYICYNCNENYYTISWHIQIVNKTLTYFPTLEIAQEVCDILNEELKSNDTP